MHCNKYQLNHYGGSVLLFQCCHSSRRAKIYFQVVLCVKSLRISGFCNYAMRLMISNKNCVMRRYLKWEDNDKNIMAWTHEWVLSHFIDPVRIDDEADIFFFFRQR